MESRWEPSPAAPEHAAPREASFIAALWAIAPNLSLGVEASSTGSAFLGGDVLPLPS